MKSNHDTGLEAWTRRTLRVDGEGETIEKNTAQALEGPLPVSLSSGAIAYCAAVS